MGIQGTLIFGGDVVTSSDIRKMDVLVQDGTIVAVSPEIDQNAGYDEVIDARGMLVLPGGVDVHTHLESLWRGIRTADDWLTGTVAAAAGGTTTVVDFCRPELGQPLLDAVRLCKECARKSVVDYGLHVVLRSAAADMLSQMEIVADQGITSFKVFMAYDGLKFHDGDIYRILRKTKELGCLALVHCENGDVINVLVHDALSSGFVTPEYHGLTRPAVLEAEAIGRLLKLAQLAETSVYIPHVSSKEAIDEIGRARADGQQVYAETCPQYLTIDVSCLGKPDFEGAKYVWSPPPRGRIDRDSLWTAIFEGAIDVVASDHSAYNFAEQKTLGLHDFSQIPNGGPTIEDRMAVLYGTGVHDRQLPLTKFVELTATTPAMIFGMYPRKGTIRVGSDADIVIWNPSKETVLSAKTHHMNVDYNIFEGMHISGQPVRTLVRGKTVILNGELISTPGWGRFVSRSPVIKRGGSDDPV